MWIELPNLWIAIINIIGIPACHLLIAWWSTQLPSSLFHKPLMGNLSKSATYYEKVFFIRHWKHLLPDAAPWFGGFSKGTLQSRDEGYLLQFVAETRRGELSHWLQTVAIGCFVLWTPWPYSIIIAGYSILSNLPCILNLRYTRQRMLALIRKKQNKHHA